jgi:myosin heavy subunit
MEQDEYKREGIDWTEIKFIDNQPLLVRKMMQRSPT